MEETVHLKGAPDDIINSTVAIAVLHRWFSSRWPTKTLQIRSIGEENDLNGYYCVIETNEGTYVVDSDDRVSHRKED